MAEFMGVNWIITHKDPSPTDPKLYQFADPVFLGNRYVESNGVIYMVRWHGKDIPPTPVDPDYLN